MKPRSFIEKKEVPGLGVPTSVDRNTRFSLQNIIENIKHLLGRIEALENNSVTKAEADSGGGSGDTASGDEVVELFDMSTAPLDAPETYLRFERDGDGDVQTIYLGTVD